jgi:hypothetical protein
VVLFGGTAADGKPTDRLLAIDPRTRMTVDLTPDCEGAGCPAAVAGAALLAGVDLVAFGGVPEEGERAGIFALPPALHAAATWTPIRPEWK